MEKCAELAIHDLVQPRKDPPSPFARRLPPPSSRWYAVIRSWPENLRISLASGEDSGRIVRREVGDKNGIKDMGLDTRKLNTPLPTPFQRFPTVPEGDATSVRDASSLSRYDTARPCGTS